VIGGALFFIRYLKEPVPGHHDLTRWNAPTDRLTALIAVVGTLVLAVGALVERKRNRKMARILLLATCVYATIPLLISVGLAAGISK
jgi:hypothetical protein